MADTILPGFLNEYQLGTYMLVHRIFDLKHALPMLFKQYLIAPDIWTERWLTNIGPSAKNVNGHLVRRIVRFVGPRAVLSDRSDGPACFDVSVIVA